MASAGLQSFMDTSALTSFRKIAASPASKLACSQHCECISRWGAALPIIIMVCNQVTLPFIILLFIILLSHLLRLSEFGRRTIGGRMMAKGKT